MPLISQEARPADDGVDMSSTRAGASSLANLPDMQNRGLKHSIFHGTPAEHLCFFINLWYHWWEKLVFSVVLSLKKETTHDGVTSWIKPDQGWSRSIVTLSDCKTTLKFSFINAVLFVMELLKNSVEDLWAEIIEGQVSRESAGLHH